MESRFSILFCLCNAFACESEKEAHRTSMNKPQIDSIILSTSEKVERKKEEEEDYNPANWQINA